MPGENTGAMCASMGIPVDPMPEYWTPEPQSAADEDDDDDPLPEEPAVKVFEVERGAWVVSEYETWVTGSYTSEEAARLAVTVDPTKLSIAWEAKRDANGEIHDDFTLDEIKQLLEGV